jgi:hypothetical protein
MKATTIDPGNITDFNRGTNQLQAFWLFCMFVTGKNSDYASRCLSRLLHAAKLGEEPPFPYFRSIGETGVHNALVASKVGQYGRLTKGIMQSLDLDLANGELDDFRAIHGVGNKTARFFLLHTREGCEYAVLDTHILAWLRDREIPDVPDSTPTNDAEYKRLERAFRYLSRLAYPGLSDSQIDLLIWSGESGRLSGDEYFDMTHPFESRDGVDE